MAEMPTRDEIFDDANGDLAVIQENDGFTPTPVISRAILTHNHARPEEIADGIVITPSHNPPADGGFKYNPPHGIETERPDRLDQSLAFLQSRGQHQRSRSCRDESKNSGLGRQDCQIVIGE